MSTLIGRVLVEIDTEESVQAHLQHYTEPSADPIPATSTLSSNTLLPLGPGTLTHNTAGVPIIVACTKADLIDESTDGLGPGASGMGGMVKGKGGEWEERTDSVMQVLRTICLKCKYISETTTSMLISHFVQMAQHCFIPRRYPKRCKYFGSMPYTSYSHRLHHLQA